MEAPRANIEDKRKQILIADDSESSRDLLRFILERSGCRVIEARDGAQALTLARSLFPDLFILDLNMPRQDGYFVASELRKQPAFVQTPIIALSASPTQTDATKIAEAGFSLFLSKPIPPSELRRCISELLAGSARR